MQYSDETFDLAAKLFNVYFGGFGAKVMAFYKAQMTAWTDPLSALADRSSLL